MNAKIRDGEQPEATSTSAEKISYCYTEECCAAARCAAAGRTGRKDVERKTVNEKRNKKGEKG